MLFSMLTSKLTTKSQTTIPRAVRIALRVKAGDEIAYQIEDGRVILTRASSATATDDPFRTFSEWNSDADQEAYADL